ncbi:MAG TPA: alpha-hydroxyketone-type quorum-sensing autoinducer synthase [Burkholderiales bacterium]|nr:alpha-hydroxyketone-type quorum-sensing autoinducer synthase [Burkholderiales bacterium]
MASVAVVPTEIPTIPPPELPEFLAVRMERYYRERVRDTWGGKHILHGRTPGPDALHLSSNDYLAIARHPAILGAMAGTLQRDGNGLLMSGIFLHGDNPQLEFESRLARFMRAQAGIVCQSGYVANTGLIQSIASSDVPVYADMLAHMSLWEGIRAAGAPGIMFHHNDPDHLRRQILRHGPGVILVDTVYSTNGSLCPLREIAGIAAERGCILVADESHSLGTHGPNGEGLVVELGLEHLVHFRTASLAKAFAARAGYIACSSRFTEYFKFESLPAIFSSTLLPHEIAGLSATLDVIRSEGWRREALRANAAHLRQGLDRLGYNLNGSQSQIISLESGTEQQTIVLRDALEGRGIFGSVFCAPATPKNRAMVRLSLHSELTREDLDRVLHACAEVRAETDFEQWPSTRRRRNEEKAAPVVRVPALRQVAAYA